MSRRRLGSLALAALACGLGGCPADSNAPGAALGVFRFEAAAHEDGCGFPSGLEPFVATLSVDPSSGRAWLASGATTLVGTLEGDLLVVEGEARRDLPGRLADGGTPDAAITCPGTVNERVELQLFGETQVRAGGCPGPGTPDAGAASALLPDGGLDVRLACGFLFDTFKTLDKGGCAWDSCLLVHRIAGERQ